MIARILVCTLVLLSALNLASSVSVDHLNMEEVDITHAPRVSNRHEDPLESELADRASLLFRSMDHDRDKKISEEDVRQSTEALQVHMPGVSVEEFLSFMEMADKNNDKMLDRDELLQGIADGLEEAHGTAAAAEAPASPAMIETQAASKAEVAKKGFFGAVKKGFNAAKNFVGKAVSYGKEKVGEQVRKVTGGVNTAEDGCVMCQYIVERCEANVKQSGVIPSMSSTASFDSYLEVEAQEFPQGQAPDLTLTTPIDPTYNPAQPQQQPQSLTQQPATTADNKFFSFQQVQAQTQTEVQADDANAPRVIDAVPLEEDDGSTAFVETESKQLYFDQTAAGIIGSTRQSTRIQRQLERQKYNEIYRVVDITLDDVCEQGMPNSFYGYCKQVYKVQSDIVDGLRYQYRPSDICFRVGMCGKGSYITKGIHSRYK